MCGKVENETASRVPLSRVLIFFFTLLCVSCSFADELSDKQRGVADRYTQLEQVLLRMSEASASSNPRRTELLKKVLLAGKDKLVAVRLNNLVALLEQNRLTETVGAQEGVEKDLLELLRMLESENRDQRREAEKERIKEFLRNLEELIHREKTVKARTTQKEGESLTPLEKEQRDVRLQTQTLDDRMRDHEQPSAAKPTEQTEPDKPEETPQEKEKAENQENKDSADPGGADPDKAPASPSRQAMQKALDRMKQAEGKLKGAEKSGALEDQEEAIAELQRVKAELEKILRQIREEEVLQTLEKLEARFKRMLRIEQGIRTQTDKLIRETPESVDIRQREIQSSRLGADQQSVVDDADGALLLLREDGTARATTESLIQTRFDMTEIKGRLDAAQLDPVTLEIEDTVIAALQEMLDAITMAIKEAEKKKDESQAPPGAGNGPQEEEPLIQLLSELRMIRSMQQRVNERTARYDKMIDRMKTEPNADFGPMREKVDELTRQQNRISRILHDLKVGKTQ